MLRAKTDYSITINEQWIYDDNLVQYLLQVGSHGLVRTEEDNIVPEVVKDIHLNKAHVYRWINVEMYLIKLRKSALFLVNISL